MLLVPGSSLAAAASQARLATVFSLCRSYYSHAIPLREDTFSKGAQSQLACEADASYSPRTMLTVISRSDARLKIP